ncbi:MAG: T9SS type A sorting domain-containing protein [Rhodothermales bacterium]|nr:T9SS type A sorting domain-containing protein [Rhodothermales bacterium]
MASIALGLACSFLLATSASGQIFDETIYVGPPTGGGSTTIGAKSNPYPTIDAAVQYAVYNNKRSGLDTQILIAPGVYRESINLQTFTNFETNQPENESIISIEAEDINQRPIISGSDVWTDWTNSNNLFTHHWPYDWGLTDVRFGDNQLTDIVKRREMVFVNGERLTPVDTRNALVAGTFFVSEEVDSLYVFPKGGLDLNAALVEIGVRPTTWVQQFEDNVTIRGLVFQHAVDEWLDGSASFRINSSDGLTIEDCSFRNNNWTGLYIGRSDSVTVRRSQMNDNGGRGLAVWNLRHARFENSETNGNNWRGFLGNFTGWTVGNNIDSSHDVEFFRHTANNNFARGLWFDTDIQDALVEESTFYNNRNDGLFLEAAQGPIEIRNSYSVENGRDGLFTGAVEKLTLLNNNFRDNVRSAIRISGAAGGRQVTNFETDSTQVVTTRWWTMTGNRFSGQAPFLLGTTVDESAWSEFTATLTSDNNDWCHPAQGAIFQVAGGALQTLKSWQAATGEDLNSTYCNPALGNEEYDIGGQLFDVSIYPNPVTASARVAISADPATAYDVKIFDALGRIVSRREALAIGDSGFQLDASTFANGTYFVIVTDGKTTARRSFTVAK